MSENRILLDYGSGGKAAQRLVSQVFVRHFANPVLETLDDAALLQVSGPIAMSTDGYTVDPIEFPGGDIGCLAVNGTVNDVAMLGAVPKYLSCGFIIEEGLPMEVLERIVASMAHAAKKAGVLIVTGDTKVVPKGAADKLFITTTGIGEVQHTPAPSGHSAKPGDAVLLSGNMGDHGLTIMALREGLPLETETRSDCAPLNHMVAALMQAIPKVHTLRDPTRGGLATTLNEIAGQSGVAIELEESHVPVTPAVAAGCAVLGLDPLYLANEGKLICIVPQEFAEQALATMRSFPEGAGAVQVGKVLEPGQGLQKGQVALRTPMGGRRLLGMLEGEQLPRIC